MNCHLIVYFRKLLCQLRQAGSGCGNTPPETPADLQLQRCFFFLFMRQAHCESKKGSAGYSHWGTWVNRTLGVHDHRDWSKEHSRHVLAFRTIVSLTRHVYRHFMAEAIQSPGQGSIPQKGNVHSSHREVRK